MGVGLTGHGRKQRKEEGLQGEREMTRREYRKAQESEEKKQEGKVAKQAITRIDMDMNIDNDMIEIFTDPELI